MLRVGGATLRRTLLMKVHFAHSARRFRIVAPHSASGPFVAGAHRWTGCEVLFRLLFLHQDEDTTPVLAAAYIACSVTPFRQPLTFNRETP